jgi:hypothetical protein
VETYLLSKTPETEKPYRGFFCPIEAQRIERGEQEMRGRR